MIQQEDAAAIEGAPAPYPTPEDRWSRRLPLLFFCFVAFAVTMFALLTVNRRSEEELSKHAGARRAYRTITIWHEQGYFSSGGLIVLDATAWGGKGRLFWTSSTGGYMVPPYLVQKVNLVATGRYNWRMLSLFNDLWTAATSVLLALLAYRLLVYGGLEALYAAILAAAAQAAFLTFPETLFRHWEISPQSAALPFAILFLLLDEHARRTGSRSRRAIQLQAATAFLLTYMEYVLGTFFLVAYVVLLLLLERQNIRWRSVLQTTLLPFAGALALFALQVTYVKAMHPEGVAGGSSFLARSGLDGATALYGEHDDIMYGRDAARRSFPSGREFLFRWKWMFIAGVAATLGSIILTARSARFRPLLLVLGTLVGAYLLYAALFSQAVVVHPYLYDQLIALPLIAVVFGFLPGMLEILTRSRGIVVTVALFAAIWYSMVQLRNYATRYPQVATPAAAAGGASAGKPDGTGATAAAAGEWKGVMFNKAHFGATVGAWEVDPADVKTFSYLLSGKTLTINFHIVETTMTTGANALSILIPGAAAANRVDVPFIYSEDGTTHAIGQALVTPGGQLLYLQRLGAQGDFKPSKDTTVVKGSITFEVK